MASTQHCEHANSSFSLDSMPELLNADINLSNDDETRNFKHKEDIKSQCLSINDKKRSLLRPMKSQWPQV